jgi:excisionase family DNA binding protein
MNGIVAVSSLENLMSVSDLVRITGMNRRRIYYLIETGRIAHIQIGQRFFFDREKIRGWLKYREDKSHHAEAA